MKKTNLLNFNLQALKDYFISIDVKPFRAQQLLKWVHQLGVLDFNEMTNFSKSLRLKLSQIAELAVPTVSSEHKSNDGTMKWLVKLTCGNHIETVFIPEANRGTLCISSQVGCALACTFCATGLQGLNRSLKTHEIIGQLWFAEHLLRTDPNAVRRIEKYPTPGWEHTGRVISNVVLMGMGEPLLNYDNVVTALRLMLDDRAYAISTR